MLTRFENKLFLLIIIFSAFCTMPSILRLNFFGSIMVGMLSIYPLIAGIFSGSSRKFGG